MRLKTKYFGEIECLEEDKLHFPDGLFGFEEEKENSLLCFQSAATPGLAFVAVNPFTLNPNYAPVLTPGELKAMGVERSEELCFYALCVVRSPASESTVNQRCPVAINDQTRRAVQVILEDGGYHMHHLLSEFGRKEEGASC